jgi:hypothetical protein
MERPAGVTSIAFAFLAVACYLAMLGALRLAFPDSIRLSLGAPLLHGLELWGPYMFLIAAAIAAIVGAGLLRLNNIARRVAAMIALAGIILLVPKVSADTAYFSPMFFLSGSMIVVRAMIVWYLWQDRTAEHFR